MLHFYRLPTRQRPSARVAESPSPDLADIFIVSEQHVRAQPRKIFRVANPMQDDQDSDPGRLMELLLLLYMYYSRIVLSRSLSLSAFSLEFDFICVALLCARALWICARARTSRPWHWFRRLGQSMRDLVLIPEG